jgi:hypothetical protein
MAGDGKKGDDSSSPCMVMMERVIGSTGEFPKLMKTNYHEWALEVHINMEGMELWDAVEGGSAECGKDRRALATIMRGVPPEMKSGLAAKKTVKEAWTAIKSLRMGDARVQEAKVQHLKQFENASFKDGEAIDDFTMRLNSLAMELCELGEKMEEPRIVKKMLRVVPARYNQIACSIEMFADLKMMPMEELVGRLRVAEERCGGGEVAADSAGLLLLTEEQWEAHRRERCDKERAHSGNARRGDDERRAHQNDYHSDDDDDDNRSTTSSGSRRDGSHYRGPCYECGERGHKAKECRGKKKETALLADVDDEPVLM